MPQASCAREHYPLSHNVLPRSRLSLFRFWNDDHGATLIVMLQEQLPTTVSKLWHHNNVNGLLQLPPQWWAKSINLSGLVRPFGKGTTSQLVTPCMPDCLWSLLFGRRVSITSSETDCPLFYINARWISKLSVVLQLIFLWTPENRASHTQTTTFILNCPCEHKPSSQTNVLFDSCKQCYWLWILLSCLLSS